LKKIFYLNVLAIFLMQVDVSVYAQKNTPYGGNYQTSLKPTKKVQQRNIKEKKIAKKKRGRPKGLVLMPYFTRADYENSDERSQADIDGLYTKIMGRNNDVEFQVINEKILLKDTTTLKQTSVGVGYTQYFDDLWMKAAFTTINSGRENYDDVKAYYFEGRKSLSPRLKVGGNVGLVSYPNFEGRSNVKQLSPLALYSYPLSKKKMFLQNEGSLLYSKPSVVALGGGSVSYQWRISLMAKAYTLSFLKWWGKRVSSILEGGLQVYNLGEVFTGGSEASASTIFFDHLRITFTYKENRFKEPGSDQQTKSKVYYWMASVVF
jgi:hypothetical protein